MPSMCQPCPLLCCCSLIRCCNSCEWLVWTDGEIHQLTSDGRLCLSYVGVEKGVWEHVVSLFSALCRNTTLCMLKPQPPLFEMVWSVSCATPDIQAVWLYTLVWTLHFKNHGVLKGPSFQTSFLVSVLKSECKASWLFHISDVWVQGCYLHVLKCTCKSYVCMVLLLC